MHSAAHTVHTHPDQKGVPSKAEAVMPETVDKTEPRPSFLLCTQTYGKTQSISQAKEFKQQLAIKQNS